MSFKHAKVTYNIRASNYHQYTIRWQTQIAEDRGSAPRTPRFAGMAHLWHQFSWKRLVTNSRQPHMPICHRRDTTYSSEVAPLRCLLRFCRTRQNYDKKAWPANVVRTVTSVGEKGMRSLA